MGNLDLLPAKAHSTRKVFSHPELLPAFPAMFSSIDIHNAYNLRQREFLPCWLAEQEHFFRFDYSSLAILPSV
jgi:hypothetical protein